MDEMKEKQKKNKISVREESKISKKKQLSILDHIVAVKKEPIKAIYSTKTTKEENKIVPDIVVVSHI